MKPSSTGGKARKKPAPLTYHLDFENKDYPVTLLITSYQTGSLAILLQTKVNGNPEDFGTITVNFADELLMPDQAYLDINNMPGIEQFIKKNHLGSPTGRKRTSGFCTYPLYDFDLVRCFDHGVLANP